MAGSMKNSRQSVVCRKFLIERLAHGLIFLAGCLASVFVHAEPLPDPTRPPDSILEPVVEGSKAQGAQSSGLHVIIIGRQRRTDRYRRSDGGAGRISRRCQTC